MSITKSIGRALSHALFQPGLAKKLFLQKYCSKIRNKRILEIGSGKTVNGKLKYSVADYFKKNSNEVMLSDINPRYKHKIVDITKSVPKGYDIIICFNVLEHVFDFHKGIENLYKSLKKKGNLMILVPAFCPLHDEPADYWRFTEHSLRRILSEFKDVRIDYFGRREIPFFYFVVATK